MNRLSTVLCVALVACTVGACGGAGKPAEDPGAAGGAASGGATGAANGLYGEDDGFHLVVFYGAELMGALDGCGCFGNPRLGGMPFRAGYRNGFAAAHAGAGVLQLDAGASLASTKNKAGREVADFVAKDDWMVRALDRFAFDAANMTGDDVEYASRFLRRGQWDAAVERMPMLARYVSANLEPASPDLVAPPAYVVRTVEGSRVPGGAVRVAVVGVTEPSQRATASGFRVGDPAEALGRVVPKARGESDVVVVLAYLPPDEVVDLARRFADSVDLFVCAGSTANDREPALEGPGRVLFARYKTESLGEARLTLAGGRVASAVNRYVKLDDPVPRDADAERFVEEAKAAVKKVQEERYAAGGAGAAVSGSGAGEP